MHINFVRVLRQHSVCVCVPVYMVYMYVCVCVKRMRAHCRRGFPYCPVTMCRNSIKYQFVVIIIFLYIRVILCLVGTPGWPPPRTSAACYLCADDSCFCVHSTFVAMQLAGVCWTCCNLVFSFTTTTTTKQVATIFRWRMKKAVTSFVVVVIAVIVAVVVVNTHLVAAVALCVISIIHWPNKCAWPCPNVA